MKRILLIIFLLPFVGFAQLSGNYTVSLANPDPNFKTLTAAVARINTVGVSGPVTFLLDENQTVISSIIINQFIGTSATNTLTIKPNAGKNITISGNIFDGAILAFNGADNIVIEGNNNIADNMLTVYNSSSLGSGQRAGIWLYNGSDGNKIQNLKINLEIGGITTGILSVGVFAGGNSIGGSGNNSNNTVLNTTFSNVKQAIYVNGSNTSNTNWKIINNKIGSLNDNSKPFLGIYLNNISTYDLSGNLIDGIKRPNGVGGSPRHSAVYLENVNSGTVYNNTIANIQNSTGDSYTYGVYMKGNDNQIFQNSIKNLNSSSTDIGPFGIRVEGNNAAIYKNDIANIFSSINEGKLTNGIYLSGNNQLVYNNFINDVKAAGGGDAKSQSGFGIYINAGSSVVKLYYNTVVLKTNQNTGVSAALFINGGTQLDIRNNIFTNRQTSGSLRFAIYTEVNNSSVFDYLDYNDYYSTQHIGSLGSHYDVNNIKTTLASWKTALNSWPTAKKDGNSIDINPTFESATDLHLQDIPANVTNLKKGMPISGITTDIDGDTRAISPDQPYIGADEIKCTLPAAAGAITGSATVCQGQSSVPYSVPTIANATSYTWSYSGTGATITGTTNSITITFASNATSGNLTVRGKNSCGDGVISANYAITINSTLSNNNLIYNSGTLVQLDATTTENGNIIMNAPAGSYFSSVKFASYGTPSGTAPNFVIGSCHSATSQSVTEGYLLGNSTATIPATNTAFGDPCSGTVKNLFVSATYTQPICSGNTVTITGSVPTGGNGTYTYEWFSSTDGVTFVRASGTYNGVNYTSGSLIQNTYYRRVVTSCTYTSTSTMVLVKLNPAIVNNNLNYTNGTSGSISSTPSENSSAVLTAPTGTYFSTVNFASYGTPSGTAPNFTIGNCHSATSQSVTEGYLLGNSTATIPATNGVFGDPCSGTGKSLYVLTGYAQPICKGTSVTITGSTPTGGNGVFTYVWESSTTSAATGFTPISGANGINYTSGGLTQTTYFRRVVTSCSSTSTSPVVMVKLSVTNVWNGSAWSDSGNVPTLEQNVEFNGNFNSSADVNGCSCQVNTGRTVVINSGHTLKITNQVVVVGTGTLTFENNASLVQVNNTNNNTGSINYKRYTNPVKRYDFTYWSSPVKNQTLYNLSPLTLGDKYYSYDSANNSYVIHYNGNKIMDPGIGYLVRAPQTFDINIAKIDDTPVFRGEPNNGIITLSSILANNVYLLGNPYPSPLDADQFLDKNASVLDGTLYFWTHNSGPNANYYTVDDYASYNRTGGVGTGVKATSDTNNPGKVPTGKIASGQGFFAPTKGAGNVEFNNEMRLFNKTAVMNNSQFFKVSSTVKESTATIEKNRIWLNLTNKEGAFKQVLVGYITGATNDYEGAFDGVTYDANEYLDFYSVNKGVNLSIQGRALPFEKKDSVALGYRSAIKGEFEISIDNTDGVLATQNVFLEDLDLKVLYDIKKKPYTFTTDIGTFNNRFVLRYVDKNAIDVTDPEIPSDLNTAVLVSVQNSKITINSPKVLIDRVIIYDLAGRKLYHKNKVDTNILFVERLNSSRQVLVVDILLSDNTKISRKIIY